LPLGWMPEKIRPFIRLSPDGRVRELSGWRVRRQGQLLAQEAEDEARRLASLIVGNRVSAVSMAAGTSSPGSVSAS
jgi:hypothetical protein